MSNTEGLRKTEAAAAELLAQRQAVYGDRKENMRRTALMWSGFLGVEIKDWQVAAMMSLYKMYRLGVTPDYSDNIDDVDGWNQMFREILGDDLIQARTVEEYLSIKHGPTDGAMEEEDYSPSGDEAFRDRLHDVQFPEDAPDTASSEGKAIDAFTSRRTAKEVENSAYFHRYHRLNNETADNGDDDTRR